MKKLFPFVIFCQTAVKASKIRSHWLLTGYHELPDPELYGKHGSCYASYTQNKNLASFPQCISTIQNQKVIVEEVYNCSVSLQYFIETAFNTQRDWVPTFYLKLYIRVFSYNYLSLY